MPTNTSWADPESCPFCDAALASPGAGFVDHVADHPDCARRFEDWRDCVGGDVRGGWIG
jgi:hypothetical protein